MKFLQKIEINQGEKLYLFVHLVRDRREGDFRSFTIILTNKKNYWGESGQILEKNQIGGMFNPPDETFVKDFVEGLQQKNDYKFRITRTRGLNVSRVTLQLTKTTNRTLETVHAEFFLRESENSADQFFEGMEAINDRCKSSAKEIEDLKLVVDTFNDLGEKVKERQVKAEKNYLFTFKKMLNDKKTVITKKNKELKSLKEEVLRLQREIDEKGDPPSSGENEDRHLDYSERGDYSGGGGGISDEEEDVLLEEDYHDDFLDGI